MTYSVFRGIGQLPVQGIRGRGAGGECGGRELHAAPERHHGGEMISWYGVFRPVVRLNEASRRGGETIGRDGETVADLSGTAIVVPLRDAAEGELPGQRCGFPQPQAEQRVQAQAEAILSIGQDAHALREHGGLAFCLRRCPDVERHRLQTAAAGAVEQVGPIGMGRDVRATDRGYVPVSPDELGRRHHIGPGAAHTGESAEKSDEDFSPSYHSITR